MTDDAVTVTFTVTGLERIEGHGRLLALAALEIDFDGVVLRLQGVPVSRQGERTAAQAPRFRNPKTRMFAPALILPDELGRRSRGRCRTCCGADPAGYLRTRLSRKCSARPSGS